MPKIRPTKIENGIQLWPCNKCGQWLPREEFYLDNRLKNKKWGIRAVCKKCMLAYHQEVYCQRPCVQEKERARSLVRGKTLEHRCRVAAHLVRNLFGIGIQLIIVYRKGGE